MLIRDGEWTLFSSDIKRKKYVWRRKNADGSWTFRTDYVVDDVLDSNAAERNLAAKGWAGDWHAVARVPKNTAWEHLMEPMQQGDHRYVSKWLNDSDHRAFRTKEGTV